MGSCCSTRKHKHVTLISLHCIFIVTLVVVSCVVNPITAMGIVPSALQIGDSAFEIREENR